MQFGDVFSPLPTASEFNVWVGNIANWLSLVSAVASVYAATAVARVRREIIGRATLPAIVAALEVSTRIMTELLIDVDTNWRALDLELARCEANLRALAGSRNYTARRANDLISQIAVLRRGRSLLSFRAAKPRDDQAWAIYASLNGLIEEAKRVSLWGQIGGFDGRG